MSTLEMPKIAFQEDDVITLTWFWAIAQPKNKYFALKFSKSPKNTHRFKKAPRLGVASNIVDNFN